MHTKKEPFLEKPVSASAINKQKVTLFSQKPSPQELFFGGRVLPVVAKIALEVAELHAGGVCVAKGMDFVHFYSCVRKEDMLLCSASVNRVWKDVMEVGLKVEAEDFRLLEKKMILSAYFLFSLHESVQPLAVAIPESAKEKKRFLEAEIRNKIRQKKLWKLTQVLET